MWGGGVEESIECLIAKAGANRRTYPYPCIQNPAKPDEAPAFARTERCDAADGRQGPRRQVVMSHPFLMLVPRWSWQLPLLLKSASSAMPFNGSSLSKP